MSGADLVPVIFVSSNAESFAAKALTTLAALPPTLPAWALVGGVAVAVNLNGFHRPTADLDTVSIDGELAIEVLITSGASRSRNGVTFGSTNTLVSLDIIDVSDGDPDHGGFAAHRFALETATVRELRVTTRDGPILASVAVPVATAAAIVAMKLQAIEGRKTVRPEKRSGDVSDIVRIVSAFGSPALANTLLETAPENLVEQTRRACRQYFETDVDRTFRWLRTDNRSQVSEIDRDDLAMVADLVDLLVT